MNTFDAIAWAIKVSIGEPMPARMLLIVGLAQRVNSNREDTVVWPSISQICEDTDMSRTSVKKWMRHLEEIGLVERFTATQDNGAKAANKYRLPVRAVFYHPRKGAMPEEEGGRSDSDRGVGRHPTGGGSVDSTEGRSTARPCIELPIEQQLEHDSELPLGLPPSPPKDPTPEDLAAFIEEQWTSRAHATPIRGGRLTEANKEKAVKLARAALAGKETIIDVWRDIFRQIDESAFLQGRVAPQPGRSPFKLTMSFLLEKRNFDKTLGGRFNGQSTGEPRRGSTSEATGRVLNSLRFGEGERARGRSEARALPGR